MSAKLMAIIKAAHKASETIRKHANTKTMTGMTTTDLCRYRDCLRMIEELGIKPEMPNSEQVDMIIKGRVKK